MDPSSTDFIAFCNIYTRESCDYDVKVGVYDVKVDPCGVKPCVYWIIFKGSFVCALIHSLYTKVPDFLSSLRPSSVSLTIYLRK